MSKIEIKLDNPALEHALKGLKEAAGNLHPALRHIGEAVKESTQQRFLSGGPAPDGTAWAPLSPATLLRKRGKGILRESGQLMDTILWQLAGESVMVGTNKVYGAIHQFGGTIQKYAHSRQLRFRTDAKGNMLSQANLGIGPKRMRNADQMKVFASKRHKRAIAKWVSVGDHQVQIPARPFLGLSHKDQETIRAILKEHLERGLSQG